METFKESYMGGLDISKQVEQKIQEIYEMYKTDAAIKKKTIEELKELENRRIKKNNNGN